MRYVIQRPRLVMGIGNTGNNTQEAILQKRDSRSTSHTKGTQKPHTSHTRATHKPQTSHTRVTGEPLTSHSHARHKTQQKHTPTWEKYPNYPKWTLPQQTKTKPTTNNQQNIYKIKIRNSQQKNQGGRAVGGGFRA